MRALESHPSVKHVTPHKMVTRTLKYSPLEGDAAAAGDAQDAELVQEEDDVLENSIHRRSLSLVSASLQQNHFQRTKTKTSPLADFKVAIARDKFSHR